MLGWDPHCHLQLSPLFEEAGTHLRLASEAGVAGCLVPSYGADQWERQDRLSEYPEVALALGIHPWTLLEHNPDELKQRLDWGFAEYPKRWGRHLLAVGEFGLDRAGKELKGSFELQKELFVKHLEWANRLELPVILHVVKAHGAALQLLLEGPMPQSGGVLHSFAGPKELINQYAELGLCFSYSANLATSEKCREALRGTPVDRIMFETDGPEGPKVQGHDVVSPRCLPEVVRLAAEILEKTEEWCWSVHRENCRRVLSLGTPIGDA